MPSPSKSESVLLPGHPWGIEPLLDLTQASQVLNLAPVTIRKLLKSGRLGAVKLNRKLLFEPSELRQYIARNRTRPGLAERGEPEGGQ